MAGPAWDQGTGGRMALDRWVVERFHRALVEEIRHAQPEYLEAPFTVAEIYQTLVPYRTHRDRIGVELNGDYEEALLHLLAGESELLELESKPARERIRNELRSKNPNTGIFREFAAVTVRLNVERAKAVPPREPSAASPPPPPAQAGPSPEPAPMEDDATVELLPGATGATLPDPGKGPPKNPEATGSGTPPETPSVTGVREPDPAKAPDLWAGKEPKVRARTAVKTVARPSDCPECASALPDRANLRFCPFCGADVLHTECTACGEELDRGWAFCIACGTPAGAGTGG